MVTPLVGGIAVAAAAYAGRYSIQAWQAFKARPPTARLRKFYEGGFQSTMTRREAALILGVRTLALASLHCLNCSCLPNNWVAKDRGPSISAPVPEEQRKRGPRIALWEHAKKEAQEEEPLTQIKKGTLSLSLVFHHSKETTPKDKIREAHWRVMVANHPDAGGSHYLASKINEAKEMMLGRTKGTGSAF